MKRIIGAVTAVLLMAGLGYAADREQYHITELTLGDPGVVITATGGEINQLDSGGVVTNDVACDDVHATGTTNDTLGVNLPATTGATLGTVTLTSLKSGATISDDDHIRIPLVYAYNDATQLVEYVVLDATLADVSDSSEDGKIDLKVMKAGTLTSILTLDASGAALDTELSVANGGTGASTLDGLIASNHLAAAMQDKVAYITVTGADAASGGTGTITIQAKDAGGNDLAARVMVRTWIGTADDLGEDALTDYSVSTGVEVEENTADADYTVASDTNGVIVMDIDKAGGAAGSVYAWAELGGRIVASGEVALTAP